MRTSLYIYILLFSIVPALLKAQDPMPAADSLEYEKFLILVNANREQTIYGYQH